VKKLLAAAPALLLVILSLWEVAAAHHDASSVPDDEAWQRAAAAVHAGYQEGDLIVFAPPWVDPVGRMHLGDLIPVEMAGRMDATAYGRIWEVSIRGAQAPEVAGLTAVTDASFAGVTVRFYERTPVKVVDSLLAYAAAHPTELVAEQGTATLELTEVGFAPHRCVQIIPPANGAVTLRVPLKLGTKLVGYVGLADVFKRRDLRTSGTLEVHAGAASAVVNAGVDDGWVRFELATTPGTTGVTFVAKAVSPDRLICFAAEARE
jgi:hypothetical protein